MNWIEKCSQVDECAAIRNCKISRLLFADDLVLLSFAESGLQRALNSFADACKATEKGGGGGGGGAGGNNDPGAHGL